MPVERKRLNMSMSVQEIAEGICFNETPSIEDGLSNLYRLNFALKVLQLDALSMTNKFPFEKYLDSDHVEELIACRYVCHLQHSFNWALFLNGTIHQETCEIFAGYLQLMSMKFQWNITHIGCEITPPYHFLN